MMRLSRALIAAIGLLVVSGPVFAHHSNSVYDSKHEVVLTGTVTEFEFVNPHTLIHFQVSDDQGNLQEWLAETAPPNNLHRNGWTSKTIKPGDQITVTGYVARNGRKETHILKISVNGKLLRGGERAGGDYQ